MTGVPFPAKMHQLNNLPKRRASEKCHALALVWLCRRGHTAKTEEDRKPQRWPPDQPSHHGQILERQVSGGAHQELGCDSGAALSENYKSQSLGGVRFHSYFLTCLSYGQRFLGIRVIGGAAHLFLFAQSLLSALTPLLPCLRNWLLKQGRRVLQVMANLLTGWGPHQHSTQANTSWLVLHSCWGNRQLRSAWLFAINARWTAE